MATTWAQFGPDTSSITELPSDFSACLSGAPTDACDKIIGSAAEGFGYCSQSAYARSTYCSCVNNSVPCPQANVAVCSNTAFSYKPYAWTQGSPSINEMCKSAPVCINLVEIGGSQNVTSGVNQSCGGGQAASNAAYTSPNLTILLMILFLLLAIVMSIHTTDNEEKIMAKLGIKE